MLHKILKSLEEDTSSSAISTVKRFKRAIASNLQTRYQENEISVLLINKASLLDPRLKSLVHLNEEDQKVSHNELVMAELSHYK